MTIVVIGDDRVMEQVRKQLGKIVTVVRIRDFENVDYVERDLMLLRVSAEPSRRAEIVELVNLFRGRVVDVARKSVIVELSGPEEKLEAFIDLLRSYGRLELARTGLIAMQRGAKAGEKAEEEE